MVHLCACGCGTKVVTPLSPAHWRLTFDGDTVSLWPSIGNWQFPCSSHYWIRESAVAWAAPMSDVEIAAFRGEDARALQRYFAHRARGGPVSTPNPAADPKSPQAWWRRWRTSRPNGP